MKKVLAVVLASLFWAGICFAEGETHANDVYEYRLVNDTGVGVCTIIPTTSIRPGVDKLIGYRIIPISALSKEMYAGVYDGTDKILAGECFGESESVAGVANGEFWIFPKQITNGVVVMQGAYTIVMVEFIST